jgi:hypothetical protein
MGQMTYKELVMLKNNLGGWDYVLNIAITEEFPIYTTDDAITLINTALGEVINDYVVTDSEIFVITSTPIGCKNCGDPK